MAEQNIEKIEQQRTWNSICKTLGHVREELAGIIPELLSLEEFSSTTTIASILSQVDIQSRSFESRRQGGFGDFGGDLPSFFKISLVWKVAEYGWSDLFAK